MSRHLLAILLTELATVRLCCHGSRLDGSPCGTVVEMPIASLAGYFHQVGGVCSVCGVSWGSFQGSPTGRDPFAPLAEAVRNLAACRDRVEVEFVIPEQD